jgi:hypothetical protein
MRASSSDSEPYGHRAIGHRRHRPEGSYPSLDIGWEAIGLDVLPRLLDGREMRNPGREGGVREVLITGKA